MKREYNEFAIYLSKAGIEYGQFLFNAYTIIVYTFQNQGCPHG